MWDAMWGTGEYWPWWQYPFLLLFVQALVFLITISSSDIIHGAPDVRRKLPILGDPSPKAYRRTFSRSLSLAGVVPLFSSRSGVVPLFSSCSGG